MSDNQEEVEEVGDPEVPSDLLDLHVALEDAGVTPEEFKEVYGGHGDEGSVGGETS